MVWEGRDAVKTGRGMFTPPRYPSKVLLILDEQPSSVPPTPLPPHLVPSAVISPSMVRTLFSRDFRSINMIQVLTVGVLIVGRNVCHGSDSVENAKKEIALWFKEGEVQSWKSAQHDWVYEK